jgi:hypothetical protein
MSRNPLFDLQRQIKEEEEQIQRSHARVNKELNAYFADSSVSRRITKSEKIRLWYEKLEELTPELDDIRCNLRERYEQHLRKQEAKFYLEEFCMQHMENVGFRSCFDCNYFSKNSF